MKKVILTVAIALGLATTTYSQVTNTGFEAWTAGGGYEDPTGWGTTNFARSFLPTFPIAVNKTTDANSGQFAAELETKVSPVQLSGLPGINFEYDTLPGVLYLGNLLSGRTGIPYVAKPTQVSFAYKYLPAANDSGGFGIRLTKFNSQTGTRQLVTEGFAFFNNAQNTYAPESVTLTYSNNLTPDTINVFFFSSAAVLSVFDIDTPAVAPSPGSKLFVDDFILSGGDVNVAENTLSMPAVSLYPNPANTILNINTLGYNYSQGNLTISFTDALGRNLKTVELNSLETTTDVSTLPAGIYTYQLRSKGQVVNSGRISIAR